MCSDTPRAVSTAMDSPEVLVSASTVAYYALDAGGEREADEAGEAGEDFLSRLAADWEAEARQAEKLGVRVVLLRSALVLGADGPLRHLRRAASLGMGGGLAPGQQRQPWIHLDDEIQGDSARYVLIRLKATSSILAGCCSKRPSA